jgi:hypothetical protein
MVIGKKTNMNNRLLKTKPCPPPSKIINSYASYLNDSSNIFSIASASSEMTNKI